MPQKSSPRMRTWGTRFDTLPISPSISPPAREPGADVATSDAVDSNISDSLLKRKDEKMPHDASVFVGSLPSTIDQQELTRLLSEHLSEHTEVKNIKVVRDSKGGVCAFVQCENAASAATLIHTLHSNPQKSFLGRNLRYEPARAFRTLLLSYRTPMQHVPINAVEGQSNYPNKIGQTVELDLPSAMRVWRPKNCKFYSLLYNAEAINAEHYARNDQPAASENASLFLQPVAFDAETIRTLAAYFGRLESINLYKLPDQGTDSENLELGRAKETWKLYPTPHDAPRSLSMDSACWEIKWDHRDDCVSALMTLRRVPHLTVTWAHQPPVFGFEQRSPYHNSNHANAAPYPLHVQHLMRSRAGSFTDPFDFTQPQINGPSISKNAVGDVPGRSAAPSEADDNELLDSRDENNSVATPEDDFLNDLSSATRLDWSDTDFPPLGNSQRQQTLEYGVWKDKISAKEDTVRSPSLTLSHQTLVAESFTTLNDFSEEVAGSKEHGQELEMPLTPGLGRSPITPKTPGSVFPPTPTSGGSHRLSFREFEGKEEYYGGLDRNERDLDPTTLFVGGLETFGPGAWDEEKVSKFFARFGGLESVKIVRPLNSHAAFAFVKFDNTEAPARAVFEEHNRVYEGRAMRVQLRDCNPPRGSWRHHRGRGRFHQPNFGPHRHLPDLADKLVERSSSPGSHDQGTIPVDSRAPSASHVGAGHEGDATVESDLPAYSENFPRDTEDAIDDLNTRNPSSASHPSSPRPSLTTSNIPPSESYREWYDEPLSAALTPPPSSFGSSTSAPVSASALPFSMTSGYYAPPQWVHPYAQQMQYQMHYMGYPGYPVAGQQVPQTFPRPPGSDIASPTGQATWPSMGVYGSYIPYQTQPVRTPSIDPSQSHLNSRAPLAPTGFIQNEQGTLIAVYQPEALDQYMSGTAAPTAITPHPVPNIPAWPQYPQPHAYPFAPQVVPIPARSGHSTGSMAWIPNQGFMPQQHSTPHIPQTPQTPTTGMGFRGGYNHAGNQGGGSPFRRQTNRRDQSIIYNNQARNNQPRTFTNRAARGNMNNNNNNHHHHPGYTHGGNHSDSRQSHPTQNSGEWNQWAGH